MEMYDSDVDIDNMGDVIEDMVSNIDDEQSSTEEANKDDNTAKSFDVIHELKYQLKFGELSREYVKVRVNDVPMKVIPLLEFKKSGKFVLKRDNGEVIQAKPSDISK